MVAMANIVKVHVTEGQRVKRGDLIIELDSSRQQMKIESARAAIRTAKAELERVRVGTVNVLQEERPDILAVQIDIAKAKLKMTKETLAMNRRLNKKGSVSSETVSANQLAVTLAELNLSELRVAIDTANAGRINSCLLYTSPSPRDATLSRMPSSA